MAYTVVSLKNASLYFKIFILFLKVPIIASLLHGNANFPVLLNCDSASVFSSLFGNREAYPPHLRHLTFEQLPDCLH